ncbi:MAG: hypothetical protein WC374_12415 [Phycisphaerae bacterium]|jgi:prophage tail gpP-like protein
MTDEILIIVNDTTFDKISELHVAADIYTAAASFDAVVGGGKNIQEGSRIKIAVNGKKSFDGIVDRVAKTGSKSADTVSISGRDLMGLIIDSHITSFTTISGKTLRQVAEYYLRQIDFVRHLNITYNAGAEALDVPQEFIQPRPGMTVFDLLSGIAAARGIHFYLRADGNIMFGRPQGYGGPVFYAWCRDGRNNTLDYNFTSDISQRYSSIVVYAQDESTDSTDAASLNKKATINDSTFPGNFAKTLVIEAQVAGVSPAAQGRMLMEQQRFNGWKLDYIMNGFTQRGSPFRPDALMAVDDERVPFTGECLVYGRQFNLKKAEAVYTTTLTLGLRGLA